MCRYPVTREVTVTVTEAQAAPPQALRLTGAIEVGRRVAEARDRRGKSQDALAAEVGVSRSSISMLEGGYRVPRVDLLLRIAQSLGVSVADLLPTHNVPLR